MSVRGLTRSHTHFQNTTTPVGVSLLAMTVCHLAKVLPDTPPSRAGSLLQGTCGVFEQA
ncbi:hypothetical protein EMIT0215P_130191 [Pseudomonas serboccidentalis]